MATQPEAAAEKILAQAKQFEAWDYRNALTVYYSGPISLTQYLTATVARWNAVKAQLTGADSTFVEDLIFPDWDEAHDLLYSNLPALSCTSMAQVGDSVFGQGQTSFNMMQYTAAFNFWQTSIGKYATSEAKGNACQDILDGFRENGIQANARINSYAFANPPDPGEPTVPQSPARP